MKRQHIVRYAASQALAREIATAREEVVRDLLAVAGPDIYRALSALTQAIGAVIADRVDVEARGTVVGAACIALGQAAAGRERD